MLLHCSAACLYPYHKISVNIWILYNNACMWSSPYPALQCRPALSWPAGQKRLLRFLTLIYIYRCADKHRDVDVYMYLLIYIFHFVYQRSNAVRPFPVAVQSKANLYSWNILPGRSWRWPLIHCAAPFPYQRSEIIVAPLRHLYPAL